MTRRGIAVVPGTGDHPTNMVHVEDAAALLALILDKQAVGPYNAAGPDPLTINQWIDEIEATLGLKGVRRLRIPYSVIQAGSVATRYRVIAREQLLMLGQTHALSIDSSLALGWQPQYDNRRIVQSIARYIHESPASAPLPH